MRVINQLLAFFQLTIRILSLEPSHSFFCDSHIIFSPIQKAFEADFFRIKYNLNRAVENVT